ncbi:integration host factor [Prescottella agglutinans]|uniref:Integration host factor n=1 Tax=Prescottella agglutinans TaxID=1644129 RepID=A0A3S3BTQ2_9NOCA|nr:integration host factor, actinobacterial type [Prescottella agglutinans]RVW09050.1 integration host factor [Prescottella agglutinans]
MALPTLTPEQRAQALEKAAASRRARATLREELKTGKASFADVLGRAGTDEIVGRAKVLYILESLPKIGKATALEIITDLGISETRRMGGLGSNQRAELLERLG